ncbi:hypothetical protein PM082_009598 [Marasmius tenuissimus]|nr:hypothetical protein PM082_009598 [Marasmius tenuissimus]
MESLDGITTGFNKKVILHGTTLLIGNFATIQSVAGDATTNVYNSDEEIWSIWYVY